MQEMNTIWSIELNEVMDAIFLCIKAGVDVDCIENYVNV